MSLCKCGCGTEIKEGRTYVKHHHLKEAAKLPRPSRRRKRKYKKRDKKFWNHKKENLKITGYCIPEALQKELDQLKAMCEAHRITIGELLNDRKNIYSRLDWQGKQIVNLKEILTQERSVKIRFAGVE